MASWWSCVSLEDHEIEEEPPHAPPPPIPLPHQAAAVDDQKRERLVHGLILTKDEIISLICDFNLDSHSHRLSSSLIIGSRCADYRPAKAILLCLCHHALISFGKITSSSAEICKSIVEVFRIHSKKPSILMLLSALVMALLLDESNHSHLIEYQLHKYLAAGREGIVWKYDHTHPYETDKLSLCCWRIVIVALFTANNLTTRRIFGDASFCELIVEVLQELLSFSKALSLTPQPLPNRSPRSSSTHSLAPVPLDKLLNIFVVGCCVALIHLTIDYLTNFQRINSISLQSFPTFASYLEDHLRPSLRMHHSLLTDDTWDILLLTKEYFEFPTPLTSESAPSPSISTSPPLISPRTVPLPLPRSQALELVSRRYSSAHSAYHSLVSTVITDTVIFLQAREEQALLANPPSSDVHEITPYFAPYYAQIISAIDVFNTLQFYSTEINFLREKSIKEQRSIQETKQELSSLSQQLLLEKELSDGLKSELEAVERQLGLAEIEHQNLVKKLEETQIQSQEKLESYHEMELAQVESVAAIMNARAKAELELDEISFKHQTELQKVNDIFHLKNPLRSSPSSSLPTTMSSILSASTRISSDENSESGMDSQPIQKMSSRSLESVSSRPYDQSDTFSLINRMKHLLLSKAITTTAGVVAETKMPESLSVSSLPPIPEPKQPDISPLSFPPPPLPTPPSPLDEETVSQDNLPPLLSLNQSLAPPSIVTFPPPPPLPSEKELTPASTPPSSTPSPAPIDLDKVLQLTSRYIKKPSPS